METPAKSSGNKGLGLMNKLRGFDGLAVSVGRGIAENAAGDEVHGVSQRLISFSKWNFTLAFSDRFFFFFFNRICDSSSALTP